MQSSAPLAAVFLCLFTPYACTAKAGSMDDAIAALMQKPETADSAITVQHVLIAFQGAPRIQGVTRTKDEAKALAEEV